MTLQAECVQNGIKLLDSKGPKHWKVWARLGGPLKASDMQGMTTCVLGRIYGDANNSYKDLGHISWDEYGFNPAEDFTVEHTAWEWNKALGLV